MFAMVVCKWSRYCTVLPLNLHHLPCKMYTHTPTANRHHCSISEPISGPHKYYTKRLHNNMHKYKYLVGMMMFAPNTRFSPRILQKSLFIWHMAPSTVRYWYWYSATRNMNAKIITLFTFIYENHSM